MRLPCTLCSIILFGSGAVFAAGGWAERMLSERSHDFGVVTHGADVRHNIQIQNPYGETIRIVNVDTTCGCTAGAASKSQLAPGESAFIEVQMNTVKFKQHKNSNVDVTLASSAGTQTVRIPIHAYIRDDVTLSNNVADFGSTSGEEPRKMTISAVYHGSRPWRITGVRPSPHVQVQVGQPRRTAEGMRYDINVQLNENAPMGAINEQIILLTEEPNRSYLPLQVRAIVEPDIVVATPVVQLGEVGPGQTLEQRVVVRGRKPFQIASIDHTPNAHPNAAPEGEARQVHIVPVSITTPTQPGDFVEQVVIKVAGEPDATCRFQGKVVAGRGSQLTSTGQ